MIHKKKYFKYIMNNFCQIQSNYCNPSQIDLYSQANITAPNKFANFVYYY